MEPQPLVLALLPHTILLSIVMTLFLLGAQKIGWIPSIQSLTKKQIRIACFLLFIPIVVVYVLFFIPAEWIMLFGYYETLIQAMMFKIELAQLAFVISGSVGLTFLLFKMYQGGEMYLILLVLIVIIFDVTLVTASGLEDYLLFALFDSSSLSVPPLALGGVIVAWYLGWSSVQEESEVINPFVAEQILHGLMRRFIYDKSREAYAALGALSKVDGVSQKVLVEKAKDFQVNLDDFQSDKIEQIHSKYVDLVKERYYPLSVTRDFHHLGERYLLTDKEVQRKRTLPSIGVVVSTIAIISVLIPILVAYTIDMTNPLVVLTFASTIGLFLVFQFSGLVALLMIAYDGSLMKRLSAEEVVASVLEYIPEYQENSRSEQSG
ncbi:MAG: hypothetical protein RTU92_14560 [Candidatus Thorarchaeota archaeon]